MSNAAKRGGGHSGRRPGQSGTREAILAAARRQLAEHGYDRASLRGIAAEAGVDQRLIAHFFGSKQQLFVAATGLPLDPAEVLPRILSGDPADLTERIAALLAEGLDRPEAHDRLTAIVRAVATEPAVATMMREFFPRHVVTSVAPLLGPGDPRLRLNLFGTQIVGLVVARYIVAVEPLASMSPAAAADAVAPTLARYLIGPLTPNEKEPPR
jgi:AcrR family transcriptional regulator